MNNTWIVYILINDKDIFYTGVTKDILRRLDQHNGIIPGGARFTRGKGPWRLSVKSSSMTRSEACKLECKIKKQQKKNKIQCLKDECDERVPPEDI